ncbi:MAG TPA: GWxTD domain-containing protein [Candidatus Mcinerneyibacteriales bacterium]|nr:GWxTD domain-containing protein [Candidatus Mcinerneyibacteriales bacterium]
MKKRIAFYLIALIILTSCLSYRGLYGDLKEQTDKTMFTYLIYWRSPERIQEIMNYPVDKRRVVFNEEIKAIAEEIGLTENDFLRQQSERIRDVNMRFGYVVRGMFTDKGMIWIKYGEPERVDENYDHDLYGTVEAWVYTTKDKVFYFTKGEQRIPQLVNPAADTIVKR